MCCDPLLKSIKYQVNYTKELIISISPLNHPVQIEICVIEFDGWEG